MFAYCLNNPVAHLDCGGAACAKYYESGNTSNSHIAAYGGGGIGSGVGTLVCLYAASQLLSSTYDSKTKSVATIGTTSEDKYSVYFLYAMNGDPNTIVYVGRVKSENFASRMAYHKSQERLLAGSIDGLNYALCRAIEQGGMMYYHTINRENKLMNQIRGISPTNSNKSVYIDAILSIVADGLYPDNYLLPASYWTNFCENEFLNLGS